jgi:hypothetical protein
MKALESWVREKVRNREEKIREAILKFMPKYWLDKALTEKNWDYFTFFGLRFHTVTRNTECFGGVLTSPETVQIYQWDRLALEIPID